MWLRTTCELSFEIGIPTPFILMLRPRSGAQQWVAREAYTLSPTVPVFEFTDKNGNLCQRLIAPPGRFDVHTSADVQTADAVDEEPSAPFVEIRFLPDSVLEYLLPSRFCETDRLGDLARSITAGCAPGYPQVATIADWVRRSIRYTPGSGPVPLSALEVQARGEGVCRDLAHLGIALCRGLCIPSRLVVGYLHGLVPMDVHAWFEAYLGGRWYTFDPTQRTPRGGRITIAYGRDSTDVALYNQYGPPVLPSSMYVDVREISAPH